MQEDVKQVRAEAARRYSHESDIQSFVAGWATQGEPDEAETVALAKDIPEESHREAFLAGNDYNRRAPHEIVLQRLRNLEEDLTDVYDTEPEGANAEALQVTDALDGFILDWCKRLGVPAITNRK